MKNKNILVFGSTGFIGRSLTKRLLQNGDKLICPVCGSKGWEFSIYNLKPAYGIYCSGWCLMNSLEKKINTKLQ